ncbi:MAG: ribose-5-phosphate isomerase RpiA [Pirellulaceae bacterium]
MLTTISRALDLIPNHSRIGLGSGRAAQAFMQGLAERVRSGRLHVYGVGTSVETEHYAMQQDIPLLTLEQAGVLDVTVDGADEVDPDLNLIKGYGRALVREKVVAAASRQLIILVGEEKLVPHLGSRGKLPVEVVPFALPLCEMRLRELGCEPTLYRRNGEPFVTDNGNYILDCKIEPIADPAGLQAQLRGIPGVVDTGLFLKMADIVLVGNRNDFELIAEKRREPVPVECSRGVCDAVHRQADSIHSKYATTHDSLAQVGSSR